VIGTLRLDGDHQAVRLERTIAAPPAEVWDALTNPERIPRWLADIRSGEVGPGGEFELLMDDEAMEIARCTVTVFEPPRVFEVRWDYTGEPASVLRLELHDNGPDTRLVLDHRGVPNARGYGAGWHAHLDLLEAVATGAERPRWTDRFSAVRPEYEKLTIG
jgi:uncharacterized protein YndB with AHSA1/START domain